MARMRQLARLIRELEDQLIVCMRCGMCQAVCPLYGETGREADVARGKLALLDGLSREMFKDPKGVSERLNRCLLCGSCAANCPSGVRVLDIFLKARAILAGYMGLSPVKKAILRGMLARPAFFDSLMEWGSRFQTVFTKPVDDMLGTSCARFLSPVLADRRIKPLAAVPFHAKVPERDAPPGRSSLRVAFFVGCLIDKIFPEVAETVLRVLDHHGVGVFLPRNQACCGIPAASSGDAATFRKLVGHNLERFDAGRFDYLVTACATCTATIRKIWPLLLEDADPETKARAAAVSSKTVDIHQFLAAHIQDVPPAAEPLEDTAPVVTYHDPCHLRKSLGVFVEPRRLIRANSNYRFREMAEADRCCGLGGSFGLEHYDLSSSIGKRKRNSIIETGCAVVATGCPACMIQLHDVLSRSGDRIAIRHAIQIYGELLDSS